MPVDLPRSSAPIRESVLQTGDGIARFSTVSLERAASVFGLGSVLTRRLLGRSTGVMNHTESGFRCPRDRGRSMNLGRCIIFNALADVRRIAAQRSQPNAEITHPQELRTDEQTEAREA